MQTITHQRHKTAVYLTKEQLDHLDRMDRDCLFSTGHRLFVTGVVGMMLEILVRLQFSTVGISSSDKFYDRLLEEWRKNPEIVKNGVRR